MISKIFSGLAPVLGGMIGQGLAPLVMQNSSKNVPWLNLVTACPLILTTLCSWFLLKSPIPKSPPSRSAEKLLCEEPPTTAKIFANLKQILSNKTVLSIILAQGCGSGNFK